MTKNYSDLDSQADVMAGLTGDLRDLQGRVIELQDHLRSIKSRAKYSVTVDLVLTITMDKLNLAQFVLDQALNAATPLALTLLEAQKALEASESPQDAPQPLRGPRYRGRP